MNLSSLKKIGIMAFMLPLYCYGPPRPTPTAEIRPPIKRACGRSGRHLLAYIHAAGLGCHMGIMVET